MRRGVVVAVAWAAFWIRELIRQGPPPKREPRPTPIPNHGDDAMIALLRNEGGL